MADFVAKIQSKGHHYIRLSSACSEIGITLPHPHDYSRVILISSESRSAPVVLSFGERDLVNQTRRLQNELQCALRRWNHFGRQEVCPVAEMAVIGCPRQEGNTDERRLLGRGQIIQTYT